MLAAAWPAAIPAVPPNRQAATTRPRWCTVWPKLSEAAPHRLLPPDFFQPTIPVYLDTRVAAMSPDTAFPRAHPFPQTRRLWLSFALCSTAPGFPAQLD